MHTIRKRTVKRSIAIIFGNDHSAQQPLTHSDSLIYEALNKLGYINPLNYNQEPATIHWKSSHKPHCRSTCTLATAKLDVDFEQANLLSLPLSPEAQKSHQESETLRSCLGMEIADSLNSLLPPSIQIFSTQRVPRQFHPQNALCYEFEYLLPMHALKHGENTIPALQKALSRFLGVCSFHNLVHHTKVVEKIDQVVPYSLQNSIDEETESTSDITSAFRNKIVMDESRLPYLFSPSPKMFHHTVYQATCKQTNIQNNQFVKITIRSQSKHTIHIRGMIGLAVYAANNSLPEIYIDTALEFNYLVPVPFAPSSPLILTGISYTPAAVGKSLVLNHPLIEQKQQEFKSNILYPSLISQVKQDKYFHDFFIFKEKLKRNQSKWQLIEKAAISQSHIPKSLLYKSNGLPPSLDARVLTEFEGISINGNDSYEVLMQGVIELLKRGTWEKNQSEQYYIDKIRQLGVQNVLFVGRTGPDLTMLLSKRRA